MVTYIWDLMRVGIFATTFEIKRSLARSDVLASAPSSLLKLSYTWDALQQFLHSATVWPYQSVLFCEQEVNTQLIFLSALIKPTTEEEDGGLLSNNNSIFFYFSGTLKMSQQLLRRLPGYSNRSMYYYLFISSLKHFSQCIRFCGCEA